MRVASLDALRGVAALAVAIPHFFMYWHDTALTEAVASLAVEVFFVLSGFVLAPQIVAIAEARSWTMLGRFLVRRWMRTLPAYLMALTLVSALFAEFGTADFWRYVFYMQNLAWPANAHDYYPIAWSLSVEEWFYISFPVVILITRRPVTGALGFIAAIAVLRLLVGGEELRRLVLFRVDAVAFGFLLWIAIRHREVPAVIGAAALLTGAVASAWTLLHPGLMQIFPLAAATLGAGAITTAMAIERQARRVQWFCEQAGAMSYAVYLYHLLALYLINLLGLAVLPAFICYLALTVALAVLSTYQIERPILALRPPLRSPAAVRDVTEVRPASAP